MGSVMKPDLTENSLGIFWDGDEVAGITAYGYWKVKISTQPLFPKDLWPPSTLFKTSYLRGEDWKVCVWDIRIFDWPSPQDWENTLKGTLAAMIEAGARVAWCGLEGLFADPPSLFDPNEMSGGVYAVLTKEYGFQCSAHLGQPFQALPDEILLKLRTLL
jgi:hypothetical protein